MKQTTDKDPLLDRALTVDLFRKTRPGRRFVGEALQRAAIAHEKKGKVFRNADGVVTLQQYIKQRGGDGDVTLDLFTEQAAYYFEMTYCDETGEKYGWAVYRELERVCLEFSLFGTLLRRIAEFSPCNKPVEKVKSLPC